jgi:RNA-directed DNA polymerase
MYARIYSWDNLRLAHREAARGKRGKPAAASFEYNLADRLLELQHELTTRTYQPGPYHSFYIHEPKRRLISAAPFRDRVVHHALCNVIEPIFERGFIHDSYANRVGKGTHRARAGRIWNRPGSWACALSRATPPAKDAGLEVLLCLE